MSGWLRTVVAVAAFLFPLAAAPAQVAPPPTNPSLIAHVRGVDDAAHARALGLDRFAVDVRLRGSVAETTITATFANPLSEILEGDFRLQLPPLHVRFRSYSRYNALCFCISSFLCQLLHTLQRSLPVFLP